MREVPPAIAEMISTYGDVFREIFDAEINWFAGNLCLLGIPYFDIIKFDEFMKKRGYREKDGSLADYIQATYVIPAKNLIDILIEL